jgi:hypothetical protein
MDKPLSGWVSQRRDKAPFLSTELGCRFFSGAELDALFTRQRGNRQVPDLP